MELIHDKKLVKIPIKDNGEDLVCIKSVCPEIVLKLSKYIEEDSKSAKKSYFLRKQVVQKLYAWSFSRWSD